MVGNNSIDVRPWQIKYKYKAHCAEAKELTRSSKRTVWGYLKLKTVVKCTRTSNASWH